ncbi:MAG: methyltransferase domain-containing protein [Pseudomonadota bacterium]|nr:methyltransferase domain-containing protein [Pseudomonadota bacterium]
MSENINHKNDIFDRSALQLQRKRAASSFAAHDFLFREVAERLADRLTEVKRRFDLAIDIGARNHHLKGLLSRNLSVNNIIMLGLTREPYGSDLVGSEEVLPIKSSCADLIVSNLVLHWTNDLLGTLIQCRQTLKPDGLFLAAMFGGNTLLELREIMFEVENQISVGVSPRISPFVQLSDGAALLQRSGYNLPVADTDTITVTYPEVFSLMHDLRGMGETNATLRRIRSFSKKEMFVQVADRYQELYGDSNGRIPATFQIIYLTGWAPDNSQPRPLRPGSASHRLADALGTEEESAGEPVKPKV